MQYDFDIEHIAGVNNLEAGLLSRLVENLMKDPLDHFKTV